MKAIIVLTMATFAVTNSTALAARASDKDFAKKMTELACLAKTVTEADKYQLVIQPRDPNDKDGQHFLTDKHGDVMARAFYLDGVCHIEYKF